MSISACHYHLTIYLFVPKPELSWNSTENEETTLPNFEQKLSTFDRVAGTGI